MRKDGSLPELLAPAGTPAALQAALDGGADAVYFGGTDFNARLRAENFTPDAMREGVKLCRAFGAQAYITLNTLCSDRELIWKVGSITIISIILLFLLFIISIILLL